MPERQPAPSPEARHFTPDGDPRGYIQPAALEKLWFHMGSRCNLSCPFCLEGSSPGDDRIQFLLPADVQPFLDEALTLGVKKLSFTGGEPFVNPHFLEILGMALSHCPALVLTNATEPLSNRFLQLLGLLEKPHAVTFRVSLDHPDPAQHDASRGEGNFALALRTLGRLHEVGFGVSLARLMTRGEDTAAVNASYAPHLAAAGLPEDLRMVTFPEYHPPGELPQVPHITQSYMATYLSTEQRASFMCNNSKMIVKKDGVTGVYACTLVDDDSDFDLGSTLTEAMGRRVHLKHHRCYSCFASGASCSEGV